MGYRHADEIVEARRSAGAPGRDGAEDRRGELYAQPRTRCVPGRTPDVDDAVSQLGLQKLNASATREKYVLGS